MLLAPPCWIFLHNRQNHFDKTTLLDNLICRRNSPSRIQLSDDACVQ
jgi:hypothetical protein